MRATTIFHSVLGEGMEKYLAHKRAIGRRFRTEENVLHIVDRYFVQEQISSVQQITPELLDAFLLSRPRESSRSYNHLLSTIRGTVPLAGLTGISLLCSDRGQTQTPNGRAAPIHLRCYRSAPLARRRGCLSGQYACSTASHHLPHYLRRALRTGSARR